MDIFGILTMVGGLALFLFGMNAMGQGLEKLSGSRLERILEKMTSNPFKAIMLGALVHSGNPVIIGNHSNGSRFCKLGYYEAVAGYRCYYGCQYRYYYDIVAVVTDRNTG